MKMLALAALTLPLSGCGMLVTINPIGMLGIVHHQSHRASVPLPCAKRPQCTDDTGMWRPS